MLDGEADHFPARMRQIGFVVPTPVVTLNPMRRNFLVKIPWLRLCARLRLRDIEAKFQQEFLSLFTRLMKEMGYPLQLSAPLARQTSVPALWQYEVTKVINLSANHLASHCNGLGLGRMRPRS
jgi:hypothetical protein